VQSPFMQSSPVTFEMHGGRGGRGHRCSHR
jgi:hypothetical protein